MSRGVTVIDMVETKILARCPHCGKSHTVRVKARVRPHISLGSDMVETTTYNLEDIKTE